MFAHFFLKKRANAPPPEILIFYDDSPSPPRAVHYLIDPGYPVETDLEKNQA
jgi:hypothetical protein